jgi:hypothetical protein
VKAGAFCYDAFARIWQTALALPLAFVTWFLALLITGLGMAFLNSISITDKGFTQLWTTTIAAGAGVYAAFLLLELLFQKYVRGAVFSLFVIIAVFNFAAEFSDDLPVWDTNWDRITRFFQGLVMVVASYVLFWQHEPSR